MYSPEDPFFAPAPPSIEDKPKRLSLNLVSASQMVLDELERENPESFSPKWMQNRLPNVYAYFTRNIREGSIKSWSDFTAQLPENWQTKWTKEVTEKWNFEKAKTRLIELLEEKKPEQFNKKWIIQTEPRLYAYFNSLAGRKETRHVWRELIESLGEWKERWQEGVLNENLQKRIEGRRKYTLESITVDLQKLLDENKPKEWSPTYIAKNARYIFRFAEKNLTNDKGLIDWDRLISRISNEYQLKWKRKLYFEDITVNEEYSDTEEVEQLIEKHRDSLYLFYESNGKEEEQALNTICLDFINLIQKGNKDAKDTFMQYLEPVVTKWLQSGALFVSLAQDPSGVKERIERCIYLWKKDRTFLGYLFRTLHFSARGLKHHRSISLDDNRFGEERSYHDTIGNEDVIED